MERLQSPETRAAQIVEDMLRQSAVDPLVSGDYLERIRREGITVSTLLTRLAKQGYMLHGSAIQLPVLLPHPGDDDHEAEKRTVGVYATDVADIALFKATVANSQLAAAYDSYTMGWYTEKFPHPEHNYVQFYATVPIDGARRAGYVYVLSKDNFRKLDDGEYVNEGPVRPILILPVEPNDFAGEFKVTSSGS